MMTKEMGTVRIEEDVMHLLTEEATIVHDPVVHTAEIGRVLTMAVGLIQIPGPNREEVPLMIEALVRLMIDTTGIRGTTSLFFHIIYVTFFYFFYGFCLFLLNCLHIPVKIQAFLDWQILVETARKGPFSIGMKMDLKKEEPSQYAITTFNIVF